MQKRAIWLSFALAAFFSTAAAQPAAKQPLLQDIQVISSPAPASATPLVKKTTSATPLADPAVAGKIRTSIPALADIEIPGYSGVIVESPEGNIVVESHTNFAFNPASNVKIATAYAVLTSFGPDYRFPTSVWTDGSYEKSTATLHGNLYVSGRDPMFVYEHAVAIANELNRIGIANVTGDLIVTDNFAMNFSMSPVRSSEILLTTFDASKRSTAATGAWLNYLAYAGKYSQAKSTPNLTFGGASYVQPMPSNVNLIFSHESAPMREIIKTTLCYSNNFLSDRLGDMVGGPYAVSRIVQQHGGIQPLEFYIQTSSGLGNNRVTPGGMMKLLKAMKKELARYKMTFADIMPVAGVDKGTLEDRFDTDFSKGSVVGKTGTLGQTDGGVSSLAGELSTRQGKFLFVIFNQRGSVSRFRSFQNYYVSLIQGQLGGAAPMTYNPISLEARLAKTRFAYPKSN